MVTLFLNHWGGDQEQAEADMESIADFRRDCQLYQNFTTYPTFLEYEKTTHDETYIYVYTVNKLIQEEDLDEESLAELLVTVDDVELPAFGCTGALLGGMCVVDVFYARMKSQRIDVNCDGECWEKKSPFEKSCPSVQPCERSHRVRINQPIPMSQPRV